MIFLGDYTEHEQIRQDLWRKPWVVFAKKPFGSPTGARLQRVPTYLMKKSCSVFNAANALF